MPMKYKQPWISKYYNKHMDKVKVYYDAACPSCRRDQRWYDRLAGRSSVTWCDITGKDDYLVSKGIDPKEALLKLHVETSDGQINKDIEAYMILFSRIYWLRPLVWLLSISWVKEPVRHLYRWSVRRRLGKEGRSVKPANH